MSNWLGLLIFLLSLTTFVSAQRSPSVLIIQSTPGGAQVYVDDELRGTSSQQQGRLKITVAKAGKHVLRLSLSGYDDWDGDISLSPGQTLTKEVSLVRTAPKPEREAEGPTVEETFAFIKSLLGEFGRASHSFGTFDEMSVASLDSTSTSCRFLIIENITNISHDLRTAPRSFSKTSVDLSTIDPASVHVEQTAFYPYTLFLHTTNNVKQIAVESTGYAANEGTTAYKIGELLIPIAGKEPGERLAKAFAHAAKLCGGKPSAF